MDLPTLTPAATPVISPVLESINEDYKVIAKKAFTLQSRHKSAMDQANNWIAMGIEKKEKFPHYEAGMRKQTPALTETALELEVRREKDLIEFCGQQAHAELDRAEKAEAEYKMDFDKYEAVVKRFRKVQEMAQLCLNCKRKLVSNGEEYNPSASMNGGHRLKSTCSGTNQTNQVVVTTGRERIRSATDESSASDVPKAPKRSRRQTSSHRSPDSVMSSSSPEPALQTKPKTSKP